MFLSKKNQSVNQFVLSNGKPPKMKPELSAKPVIKMAVITPHEIVLRGLKVMLSKRSEVQITRENQVIVNALNYLERQEKEALPDLVVVDTKQREMSCCEAIMRLKWLDEKMKVLVMGDHFRNENITDFFGAGAEGYIDQSANGELFAYAASVLAHDGKYFLYTRLLAMRGYIMTDPIENN